MNILFNDKFLVLLIIITLAIFFFFCIFRKKNTIMIIYNHYYVKINKMIILFVFVFCIFSRNNMQIVHAAPLFNITDQNIGFDFMQIAEFIRMEKIPTCVDVTDGEVRASLGFRFLRTDNFFILNSDYVSIYNILSSNLMPSPQKDTIRFLYETLLQERRDCAWAFWEELSEEGTRVQEKVHFFTREGTLLKSGLNVVCNLAVTVSQVSLTGEYASFTNYFYNNSLANVEFWGKSSDFNKNLFFTGLNLFQTDLDLLINQVPLEMQNDYMCRCFIEELLRLRTQSFCGNSYRLPIFVWEPKF